MTQTFFRRAARSLLPALGLALSLGAFAEQGYPSRPLRLVVPFAAGGAVDTVARVIGARLSTQLGQPVLVENKPGANGDIGADVVAKAAPDGYTLLVGANGLATNMTLYPKLPFNTLRDFAPISRLGYAPLVLVTASSQPFKTTRELLAWGEKHPGQLTYGSAGNGSSGHLAGALLASTAHIDAMHVPYKGGAPALVDLIAGRTSFMLLNPLEVLAHVKSGRLRALGASGSQRIALLPEVPTLAESGLPGFEASVWWGLLAPAGTPSEIVARLNAETTKALADPAVRERLMSLGAVITPSTPDQFSAFLHTEIDKWAGVIKAAHIQAD
ncbi:tripartite tricarboxylate transporter substrate binding protein [Polaromonas sp. C04]|uniref:tripartite tricarboxylate transporter substrate binding protein n=1 Tax=Polaromonas sp. C04 TaxID=1945857 RepID=UPI0009875F7B|nr:tripartite tricarboxylate transporter substrate binding protein [Polaromonas sp. C04]OOG58145.1 LacI family transcriptional regulator [Polaromonas sp. C04]